MLTILCWLAGCGLSAMAGVMYSTQIKDWVKGIPAAARAEITKLEDEIIARVKKAL